ncbi:MULTISPECIES: hypothetical protein [unclassified Phycicoccus]|uniref:hypothetical protein n=1 Tax=unclassified Phycicoccus TaxID=2637926 RepID=UPI0007029FBC|nr:MULTISPECIES: hypothetical protein [unclassified Phycicoccus]KQU68828.1 hypothetical protein ASC58_09080 [Phycicoccus sp. Root101]KQZ88320.1 hypothetical protein ASD62_02235 [Phycicoccus sp. Root563]
MELTVMADWNADPVWTKQGMVDLETLPLSPRLTADLLAWARRWEELHDRTRTAPQQDSYSDWVSSGRRLSRDLQLELGPAYDVEYAHDHEG